MITGICVRNFKSLVDFKLEGLSSFSCLIGLNGAGKTTILQLIDFIGHLVRGSVDMRGWNLNELITNGSRAKTFHLTVDFLIQGESVSWAGTYYVDKRRLEGEHIRMADGTDVLKIDANNILTMRGETQSPKKDIGFFNYQGSFLSFLKTTDPLIIAIQKELSSLKSLELLNPVSLRKPSQANEELGIGGDGLPGFLSKLTPEQSCQLLNSLREFYPRLQAFEVKRRQFGWKNLLVKEFQRTVQAGHINDGLLRILAILSQRYSNSCFLLFDEIENGINQEIIQKLVADLQAFEGKQVMVTTHSALVLNYLTDEVAKNGVYLLYQDEKGYTHATKFFDIPEIASMLEFMGPGQVMSQTNLVELATKLARTSAVISGTEA